VDHAVISSAHPKQPLTRQHQHSLGALAAIDTTSKAAGPLGSTAERPSGDRKNAGFGSRWANKDSCEGGAVSAEKISPKKRREPLPFFNMEPLHELWAHLPALP